MNTKIAAIQKILFPDNPSEWDNVWGNNSAGALRELVAPKAPRWPFEIEIDGDDIILEGVITCFGGWGSGIADPQDNGGTASGMNTKTRIVEGVSIAMDGRQFSTLNAAEHRALDGAPVPRLFNEHGLTAWHTPIEVTIGGVTYTPRDGLVDLGPGLQATKHPDEPHVADLSVFAAHKFHPEASLRGLATNFCQRGKVRIIGGAKLGGLTRA
jgi:hypothetical protein